MSKAQRKARNAMSIRTFIGSAEYKAEGGSLKDAKKFRNQWHKRDANPGDFHKPGRASTALQPKANQRHAVVSF